MNIQAVVSTGSGCDYHRIVNPMQYMPWEQADTHSMLWRGPEESKIVPGIVWYNKFLFTPPAVLKNMKDSGLKIVLDIDDLWDLPDTHPNHSMWEKAGNTTIVQANIEIADIVICTSMHLQDKVREYNKNTVVIPNAFPFGQENYLPQPVEHDRMVFMYMGGSTHYKDVRLLEGKFRRIASDPSIKNNSTFALAGYDKAKQKRFLTAEDRLANNNNFIIEDIRGDYDRMASIFSYTGSYTVLPTADLDSYINYYDHASVALVPLVENEWNSYKSILKVIEAGVKGIPVICSKVAPYYPELKDCPGILWVNNSNDWLIHIRWCLKNKSKVQDMGKELHEYIKEHYELTLWNQVRYDILKSI